MRRLGWLMVLVMAVATLGLATPASAQRDRANFGEALGGQVIRAGQKPPMAARTTHVTIKKKVKRGARHHHIHGRLHAVRVPAK